MKKVLVVFYSWHGNVRKLASLIAGQTGGNLLELKPVLPYPINYRACVDQVEDEVRNGYLPEVRDLPNSIETYDMIFMGSPIWWHTMAPPLATFVNKYDLSGKIIAPFYSHGGSGAGTYEGDIKEVCKKAKVTKAFGTFDTGGRNIGSQIEEWIKSFEL